MTNLKRVWPALESLPSLAAVEAEWRTLVRDDYRLIKPFLRPRKDRASSFPHPDGGLQFRVVEHGSDDFVGVCEETGDIMTLTKSQLVVYELDPRKLGQGVADACGIDRSNGSEDWNGMMVHLGHFTSAAKTSYDAFLAFPNEPEDVHRAVTHLVAEKRTPFILFAPTRQWLRRTAETAMRMHGCVFVPLTDIVTAPRPGVFELLTPMDSIITRDPGARPPTQSALRNTFRRDGDFWILGFADKTIRLKDHVGFKYIAHLLSKRQTEIHVAVLMADVSGNPLLKVGAGSEMLGEQGKQDCVKRYDDLRSELAEAERNSDLARCEYLQQEIETLTQHVNAAFGLGGRTRKIGDETEKARKSVSNAITRAIDMLDEKHPELARHLDNCIRKGQFLSYSPEADVDWDV